MSVEQHSSIVHHSTSRSTAKLKTFCYVCAFCFCVRQVDEKVKVVASPKIPLAKDAAKHKAGGGNVEICTSNNKLA